MALHYCHLQVVLHEIQVGAQNLNITMTHQPLQNIDIHPIAQAPQSKCAAQRTAVAVSNAGAPAGQVRKLAVSDMVKGRRVRSLIDTLFVSAGIPRS
jgi:hypothetical protein